MELSGFFGSVNGDRKYRSKHWANYFSALVGNGIVSRPLNGLQVVAGEGMTVVVRPGRAYINGYDYENTENLVIRLQNADGVLNRIDRIVLQWNLVERAIRVKVSSSPFATTPVLPGLRRNPDMFELCLADVSVNRGITSVAQSQISDQRLNPTVCGVVGTLSETIDTEEFAAQLRSWFEIFTEESKLKFLEWFGTVREVLDEDTAGKLHNLISDIKDNGNVNLANTHYLLWKMAHFPNAMTTDEMTAYNQLVTQNPDFEAIVEQSRVMLLDELANAHINATGNAHDVNANQITSTGLASDTGELAATLTVAQNLGRAMGRINARAIRPQTAAGIGQWQSQAFGWGASATVPAGTWAWFALHVARPSATSTERHVIGISSGVGTGVVLGAQTNVWYAMLRWRVS